MTLGDRPPMRGSTLNGAPRHHNVYCSAECGWRGNRTADSPELAAKGKPCPRCHAPITAKGSGA